MIIWFIAVLALLLGTTGSTVQAQPCGQPSVAFSFDDPPTGDTVVMTGAARTQRILSALEEGGVEEAIFFAVSSRVDANSEGRLRAYGEAGHLIANHSHSHPNLHRVGTDAFLEDVRTADEILSEFPNYVRLFRFPYLNEGATLEQRDAVRAGLDRMGYRPGYVTIDTFDFYVDRMIREAFEQQAELDLDAVAKLYVDTILGAAAHYDSIACSWLGRSPHHVLLLHENDAAALFLDDLIEGFHDAGWAIVSAREAYADAISAQVPETLFLGQGRVAALAAQRGADESDLRHDGENVEYLRAMFAGALGVEPE